MDKKQIIKEIKKNKCLIKNKKIVAVYLFGSVAFRDTNNFSDVDICILGNEFGPMEKLRIIGGFPDNYDVSFFEDMPPWIKMRVLRGIPIIMTNSEDLYSISFKALAEYEDLSHLLNQRVRQRFGKCMI